MGTRCADHVTPLCPQKLALTSPTGGDRSVGIVRSRTKATEFSFSLVTETCLILMAFQGQQWLRERASMLRYMYNACLDTLCHCSLIISRRVGEFKCRIIT